MKVLFDGRVCCDHFTGIGRYAFGLLRHLPAAFPEIEFTVAWNPSLPNRRFDWGCLLQWENVRKVTCAGTGLGLLDPLALRSVARAERADLLHAPYFTGALASPVPSIVTIYDVIPFDGGRGPRSSLARWGLRRAARAASKVITLTESVRADILERFGLEEARVIALPAGVDPPFRGSLHDPSLASRPYVLSVGVMKPHKNLSGLLDGMALAFPTGGVRLVLAGPTSSLTQALRDRAASLGLGDRLVVTGPLEEAALGPLYRNATAVALVSFSEGFGLTLAEAMSARVPVVASDIPVLREVGGGAAIYVDPRSPVSIAEGLTRAVSREGGVSARLDEGERRAAALSWPAIAPRYGVCYR
jgi:glycosyltransferase involved in cell wall biosynthesis